MAELQISSQPLPGIFLLDCSCHHDSRGDFTKLFHAEALLKQGISFTPAESFFTRSRAGVIRGMHFQVGEAAHDKLVFCTTGRFLDVVVDVRPDSPHFNRPFAVELTQSCPRALLISKGYAHGFLTLEQESSMLYFTTTVHCPTLDWGVLWSSIDFDWPVDHPILSDRDRHHPPIQSMR